MTFTFNNKYGEQRHELPQVCGQFRDDHFILWENKNIKLRNYTYYMFTKLIVIKFAY